MAKSPSMNIQDSLLNQVRKEGTEVKIALIDGSSLLGQVRGFDNFTVVVQSKTNQHLLYKHAIAQIIFRRPGARHEEAQGAQTTAAARPQEAEAQKPNAFYPIDLSGLHTEKEN